MSSPPSFSVNASMPPRGKYKPYPPLRHFKRSWPDRQTTKPPIWCSVDLRDGNQALIEPMGLERKIKMFQKLVAIGYREIEIGFPSASQTDFDFTRHLIEKDLIPEHVLVQALTQAREDLIKRTYQALEGVHSAIVHVYNSTSTLQRRVVFDASRDEVKAIATRGAAWVREHAERDRHGTRWFFEYSPESFTGTEIDYAIEVCDAVNAVWEPRPSWKVIHNLPATVEMSTPNLYADLIEYFHKNMPRRDSIILSLHPHNDRGTGIAAAELGLLAGAERIEGTLFGNGERTGNTDLVTLALNLYTQGVDPGIDFSDLPSIRKVAEHCNRLPVPERHPYAGDLVFTAFSGSHQDAIKKGFAAMRRTNQELWEVPYLPIDPKDVGRTYEAVVRINSQSGKGGVAYIMERDFGLELPKRFQSELSRLIQHEADASEQEVEPEKIWDVFQKAYLTETGPLRYVRHITRAVEAQTRPADVPEPTEERELEATILVRREHEAGSQAATMVQETIRGTGNGPIDAFLNALRARFPALGSVRLVGYHQHALSSGSDAQSAAFIELQVAGGRGATSSYGVALHPNISAASLIALARAAGHILEQV